MCEKCGYSGCNHDWKRWAPAAYQEGFRDAFYDKKGFMPYGSGSISASAYHAGRIDGRYARNKRAATTDPDAAALAVPAWDEEVSDGSD